MDAAKNAAKTFVNIVLGENAAAENKIAVVDFSERASTVQNLSGDNATVLRAIDKIKMQDKDTNIQAGIHQAKEILDNDADFQGQKVILVFSDGMPTYSYRATGTAQGNCSENWWGEHQAGSIISGTEVFQNFDYDQIVGTGHYYDGYAESNGWSSWKVSHVYGTAQVTCGHNKTWTDTRCDFFTNHGDPTIREAKAAGYPIYSIFLDGYSWDEWEDKQNAQYTMKGIAVNGGEYQTTENLADLAELFEGVAEDITTPTNAGIVTDPMGQYIQLGDVTALEEKGITAVAGGLEWEVTKGDKAEEGANTTTYTVTYPVTLDTNGDGFKSNEPYPTNGKTTFHYSVNGENREVDFNVPTVAGLKDYQVVYAWATGSGQPSDVTLPASATVAEENSSAYQVADLPTTSLSGFTAITGWHVSDDPDSNAINGLSEQDLAALDTDDDRLVTLYAYCQQLGTLTISKTFSYQDSDKTTAPTGFAATFSVKDSKGEDVTGSPFAYDGRDIVIRNLPYDTYTVTENITNAGNPGAAYNRDPQVSYNSTVGTSGTVLLNSAAASMAVANHYKLTNSPIVGITKTATPTATAGDTITYTITVTNTGGGKATNVVVTDALPDGLVKENEDVTLNCPEGTDCSYDPQTGTVTWTIPSLAAQTGKAELTVQVKVADSALNLDKITNTAYMKTYDGYEGGPISASAETKITKSNLSIAKSASSSSNESGATAKPGDAITYTITVKNTGDADAKGKTVIDTLPSAGLQNINPGTGTYNKDQNTITWRDLTISAGETVTLTVTADVAPLANTSQGITLVNNVAMDDLSASVTTRVGATTATLTIEKYVTGLPAADTAAWNALVNAVSFTVTGQPESGGTFTPVTVDLDQFQSTVSGVYTYSLENLAPGTYTVTENGYDVLSTYGYTWNAENSAASVEKTVTAGVPASAAIHNEYDSREFTIIFDSNTNGVLLNRDRSTVAMGDSFRYGWIVPTGNETVSIGPSWAGALDGETFNGSPNSQVSYTFTKAEYLEYGNHNTYSMAFSQPGVTANDGYSFTGSFTTTGAAEGMKFESLANTMAYLLASDQDQITYYANYTANGTQPNPDPIEPGPNPDPIEPGPSDPGTDIPDDNTPTTDLPEEETPTTELPDEETPMTEEPVEELPDEDVPMAEVPATGDTAGLWALAAGVSGLALVWLALSGKKRREENA